MRMRSEDGLAVIRGEFLHATAVYVTITKDEIIPEVRNEKTIGCRRRTKNS